MVVFIDACDFFLLFSVWFWSYSLKDDIEFTIVRETIYSKRDHRKKLEASFTIVSMNCFIKVYTLPNTFINPRFWSSKFQKKKKIDLGSVGLYNATLDVLFHFTPS
jgi:hypothetical protein